MDERKVFKASGIDNGASSDQRGGCHAVFPLDVSRVGRRVAGVVAEPLGASRDDPHSGILERRQSPLDIVRRQPVIGVEKDQHLRPG